MMTNFEKNSPSFSIRATLSDAISKIKTITPLKDKSDKVIL